MKMISTEIGLNPSDQLYVRQLCERSQAKIRKVAYRYLYDISPTLVDDVEQETYLLACLNIDTLRNHERPEGWLIQTATYVAWDIRRKESSTVPLTTDIIDDSNGGGGIDECLPSSLKPNDQDILKRYYERQDNVREIASDLNEHEETIKKRLARARQRLKQFWSDLF